jgi:GAF domain-containing protein
MRRGAKPAKARAGARPPVAGKPRKRKGSGRGRPETRLEQALKREAEALAQQAATTEILRVISSSPADAQPVLDAVAQSASRLCDAHDAWVARLDGDVLRLVARHGPLAFWDALPVIRGTVAGRTVIERRTIHVTDLQREVDEYPEGSASARQVGDRTILSVPLLREGVPIGVIQIPRREARPFTDRQIALLETFAAQAVIAIENARLFNELQSRNRDLTATGEILQVISRSPTHLQPVFDAIADSAVGLCGAIFGGVFRFDGELVHFVAHHRFSREALDQLQRQYPTRPRGLIGDAILDRAVVHSPDVLGDPRTANAEVARLLGYRSFLGVPMVREGQPIGAIAVFRAEAEPFAD